METIGPKQEKGAQMEVAPEMIETCQKSLVDYMDLKPEERILILTDKGTDPEIAEIFRKALAGRDVVEISAEEKSAAKGLEKIKADFDVAIELSYAPGEGAGAKFWDWFESDKNERTRTLALPGFKPDVFEEGVVHRLLNAAHRRALLRLAGYADERVDF